MHGGEAYKKAKRPNPVNGLAAAGAGPGRSGFAKSICHHPYNGKRSLHRIALSLSSDTRRDPLIFQTAVAKLGADPPATWFVGDNLTNDIAGANGAGLFSVWYNPDGRANGDIEPDAMVGSWEEFGQLVKAAG